MTEDRFLLEVGKRKVVYESLFLNGLSTTVDFMVAIPEDKSLILRYVNETTTNLIENKEESNSNITHTENIKSSLENGLVILATDCFEICGLIVGNFAKSDEVNKTNQKVLVFQLICVSAAHKNSGIEERLWKELLKLRKLNNAETAIFKFPTEIDNIDELKSIFNENSGFIHCDLLNNYLEDEMPSLPEAYRLPQIERLLITEVFSKRLGRNIRYEIAKKEDVKAIKTYLRNEYFRQTMVTRTLQCRKEDGDALLKRFKPEILEQEFTILAIYEGKICGLMINEHSIIGDSPESEPNFPDDFTQQIDEQPFTHKGGKTVLAIGTWMKKFTRIYIPNEYNDYFYLDMLSVHPHFRGCKIGWTLWIESIKLGRKAGYHFSQTICTAIASNKIASDSGMKNVLKIQYNKVKYNGKEVFEDGTVYDGGRDMSMYIGNLEEMFPPN